MRTIVSIEISFGGFLAFAVERAVAETFRVHLREHPQDAPRPLRLSLRQ